MKAQYKSLYFEYGFNEQDAHEARLRGYRSHVWVDVDDGSSYPVAFFDATRLSQELASEAQAGRPFLAEPGLIVVTEVTLENMEAAARKLVEEGFFENRPVRRA
jgi:hypothetical protein